MLRTCASTVRGLRKSSRGDLAVRAPDREQAHRPRPRGARGPPPSCAAAARRPSRRSSDSPRRAISSPRRAAPAAARRGGEPSGRRSASRSRAGSRSPGGGEGHAGAQLDLGALEGDVERRRAARARAPSCSAAVSASPSSSAVSPSAWASAAQRVGMPGVGRDARQRVGAARAPRAGRRWRRRSTPPSAGPRRRSGGPRCAPSARARSGSARQPRRRSPVCVLDARRARRRCRRCIETTSSREAVSSARSEQRRARRGLAAEGVDRAEDPVDDERVSSGGRRPALELAAQLDRPRPSRPARAGRRPRTTGSRARARRRLPRAQPDGGGERLARAAVVARGLERRTQALVELGGLRRELVREREREPGADRLDARREVAALGGRDALEPERPGAQIDALGALRLLPGLAREGDRLAVLARALQVPGDDEPLGGRLAGQAVGREASRPPRAARRGRARGRRAARRSRRGSRAWRKAPAPGSVSTTQPAVEQLGQPAVAAERGHELEVEARAGHRRGLGAGARGIRQTGRAQQHGVADGLGHRDLAVAGELETARARGQPAAGLQRAGQLLDEERDALGAVVDRPRQRAARAGVAEDLAGQRRRALGVERLERELAQGAGAGAARCADARSGCARGTSSER